MRDLKNFNFLSKAERKTPSEREGMKARHNFVARDKLHIHSECISHRYMKEKKAYMLPIRWSYEEKALIEKQAEKEGLSVTAFVRSTVIKHCRDE